MSQPAQSVNIRKFMARHLVDVFEMMLSMKASPVHDQAMPSCSERVTGTVGFAGEEITGAVYLHLSGKFAARIAGAMLGLEEVSAEAEINDVVGEVTNMLAGGLKSVLCDAGTTCAVSTPAIIRGASFMIESVPDVERIWLSFGCEGERVSVEVHVQYL